MTGDSDTGEEVENEGETEDEGEETTIRRFLPHTPYYKVDWATYLSYPGLCLNQHSFPLLGTRPVGQIQSRKTPPSVKFDSRESRRLVLHRREMF